MTTLVYIVKAEKHETFIFFISRESEEKIKTKFAMDDKLRSLYYNMYMTFITTNIQEIFSKNILKIRNECFF